MFDLIIRGGTVVDGTGSPPRTADVGITAGRIAEVGRLAGPAREVLAADGAIVTPGFVDVHTHYDGQATWDDALEPSAANGVTTVVMGNCGVGFAPVRPGDHAALIDLMEGVEDIPGTALSAGMPWGAWETFAEYLEVLAARHYALDVAAQVPHGALRFYVMGERGAANEDATDDDLAAMAAVVQDALGRGAVGFSTSRTIGHRARSGRPVPGTFAADEELLAIARAFRAHGRGVFQAIVAGTIGRLDRLGGERATPLDELPLLEAVATESGRPVTFTIAQLFEDPDHWRRVLEAASAATARGAVLRPQVIPRSVTIMTTLDAYHLFLGRPTYERLAHLPLAARVVELRRPEVRAAILSERSARGQAQDFSSLIVELFALALPVTFPLRFPIDYEPTLEQSVFAEATRLGIDPEAHMYDLLLRDEGRAFYALFGSNYVGGSLEACRDMLLNPNTVTGLGDAGAHVNLISDCSATTFHLTHWARDRARGDRVPLELVVRKLTKCNADLYGLSDRGVLAPGRRADLNVIDFERLTIRPPELRFDLPAGASRILQPAEGYLATLVHGVVTRRDDADTGERPGRLATAA